MKTGIQLLQNWAEGDKLSAITSEVYGTVELCCKVKLERDQSCPKDPKGKTIDKNNYINHGL